MYVTAPRSARLAAVVGVLSMVAGLVLLGQAPVGAQQPGEPTVTFDGATQDIDEDTTTFVYTYTKGDDSAYEVSFSGFCEDPVDVDPTPLVGGGAYGFADGLSPQSFSFTFDGLQGTEDGGTTVAVYYDTRPDVIFSLPGPDCVKGNPPAPTSTTSTTSTTTTTTTTPVQPTTTTTTTTTSTTTTAPTTTTTSTTSTTTTTPITVPAPSTTTTTVQVLDESVDNTSTTTTTEAPLVLGDETTAAPVELPRTGVFSRLMFSMGAALVLVGAAAILLSVDRLRSQGV